MKDLETRLTGGHPNSLGNTVAIVEEVLAGKADFDELFDCYFSEDEVVRLRTSNAMKRICRADKQFLLPYLDRFLTEIARIDQPSNQWSLAQLFALLEKDMSAQQKQQARELMKNNLEHHHDWIVLNMTMDTLGAWAKKDEALKAWLAPHLQRLSNDPRKSVAKKAMKTRQLLENNR